MFNFTVRLKSSQNGLSAGDYVDVQTTQSQRPLANEISAAFRAKYGKVPNNTGDSYLEIRRW